MSAVDAGGVLRELGMPQPPRGFARLLAAAPPDRQRAAGAWLARMFAAEQTRQVASAHGGTAAAEDER